MARAQAEFLIGDGDQALEEARYDDALASFDRAVAADPSFADAYLSRGNARFALRRFDEAEQDYQAALLRDADLADAYLALGMLDWILGRLPDAEKDFAVLVLRRPESRFYAGRYALVLYDEGKKQEVQDFYQKLLDADHSRDWAAEGLLYAVEANAADPQQGTKARLDKAQELWADGVRTLQVRYAIGEGLFQAQNYASSLDWLKPLMDEDPNKVPTDAVQHLAYDYKAVRQIDGCVQVWRDYMNRMGRGAAFDEATVRRGCEV
jgi:tetratricopeptide (TPR) repeat protein